MKSFPPRFIARLHPAITCGFHVALTSSYLDLFASFNWIFELFDHARIQLFIISLIGLIYFLLRKRYRSLCFAIIATLVNLWPLVRTTFPMENGVMTNDSPTLKVISYNVLVSNKRYEDSLSYLQSTNADVIILYEVNDKWLDVTEPLRQTHPHGATSREHRSLGISLYSRHPLHNFEIKKVCESGMPCATASLYWQSREIRIIGFHPLPPISENLSTILAEEFKAMASFIAANPDVPTLMVGDFNTTPWSSNIKLLRRQAGVDFRTPKPVWLPTWNTNSPLMLPIDHALCSKHLLIKSRVLGPNLGSDHLPQELQIQFVALDP